MRCVVEAGSGRSNTYGEIRIHPYFFFFSMMLFFVFHKTHTLGSLFFYYFFLDKDTTFVFDARFTQKKNNKFVMEQRQLLATLSTPIYSVLLNSFFC